MVNEDEDEDFGHPTVQDRRKTVRSLIESKVSGGYHPLRKHEKHRAYYCLTGEKLGGDASNGEVSYRLLELLVEEYDGDFDLREAFDAGGPLTKDELGALVDALRKEAGEICPNCGCEETRERYDEVQDETVTECASCSLSITVQEGETNG